MSKIFLAVIFCSVLISSCKEGDKTFCYECITKATMNDGTGEIEMPDMDIIAEQCGWTEAQAKTASTTVTTTAGSTTMIATTTCDKK